jgi:hypothetical protein
MLDINRFFDMGLGLAVGVLREWNSRNINTKKTRLKETKDEKITLTC